MRTVGWWFGVVAGVLVAIGCGDDASGDRDAGAADAGGARDAGGADAGQRDAGAPTTIAFSLPAAAVTHVRGVVDVQLVTTGRDPDRVELWRDGELLVVLEPPYTYAWNSDIEAEGPRELEARALRSGGMVASATRTLVVDRTPPRVIRFSPTNGASDVALPSPIAVFFSEAIAAATVTDASASLSADSGAIVADRALAPDGQSLVWSVTTAPPLPAVATVRVTTGLTDLSGNALMMPGSASFTWPTWVPAFGPEPLGDTELEDFTVSEDGSTAWISYTNHVEGTEIYSVHVARWTGTAWEEPAPITGSVDARAGPRIRFYDGGLFLTFVDTLHVQHATVLDLDRLEWTPLASAPVDRMHWPFFVDLELDGTSSLLLARFYNGARGPEGILVHRFDGTAWTAVHTLIPISLDTGASLEVMPDRSGQAVVAYSDRIDCHAVRGSATGWLPVDVLYNGSGGMFPSRCVTLGAGMGGDGIVRVGFAAPPRVGSTGYVGYLRDLTPTGWVDNPAMPENRGIVTMGFTDTGFVALAAAMGLDGGMFVFDEAFVADPTHTPEDLDLDRVLRVDGRVVVAENRPMGFWSKNEL